MEPSEPPATDPGATDDVAVLDAERARTRRVVVFTSLLTVLVMGSVIALGLGNKSGDDVPGTLPPIGSSPPGGRGGMPPRSEWPDEGCAPDPANPPKLTFLLEEGGLDFGQVKQGVVMTLEVGFRNDGTGPLCIFKVDTGCGCIKAKFKGETRKFEAGEEGVVEVILDSAGRQGLQRKHVTLYTNDPTSPLRAFEVRAEVTMGLVGYPYRLNFGRVTPNRAASTVMTLRSSPEQKDWAVTEVIGTQRVGDAPVAYAFEILDVEDPRAVVKNITIRHPGLPDPGTFQDTLTVRTTHPERPELVAQAYLMVVSPIAAVPPRAVLGFVSPAEEASQRIRIVPGDASVACRVNGFSWEGRDGKPLQRGHGFVARHGLGENGEWWVDISYDQAERGPGPIAAVLVVHTDQEAVRDIRIPCFAHVEAQR